MKQKFIRLLTLTLALLLCMSALLACNQDGGTEDPLEGLNDADRAVKLYELAEAQFTSIASYTEMSTVTGEFYPNETTSIGFLGRGTVKQSGIGTDTYMVFSENAVSVSATATANGSSNTKTETMTSTQGFQNGKMFQTQKEGENERKLYSSLTAAEYAAHVEAYYEQELKIDGTSCTTKTSVQQADGTWMVTFSDFTEAKVAEIIDLFAGMADTYLAEGQKVSGVKLTAYIRADFRATKQEIQVFYTNEDTNSTAKLPTLTMTTEYKDFGATTVDAIDFTGYTETGDLRQIDIFEKKLEERTEAVTGRFEYTTRLYLTLGSARQTQQEIDNVTFSREGGKLSYNIEATVGSTNYTMTYADGTRTVAELKANGQTGAESTTASDDASEQALLLSLMDPAGFSASDVEIVIDEDSATRKYRFVVRGAEEKYASLIAAYEGTVTSSGGTILVEYDENGNLLEYTYQANVEVSTSSGTLTITETSVCEYK